ncbi:hypothetical protein KFL_001410320 [Klebsormidium nitens]|uniref:Major facilitator superfamily protein n=1 Tax=Klebsormidium nitens TaxID=105231 RepID=A0A0U9HJV2_KLENI|nr:hypothetical protein KFL_001410320 [Klebsormidium nitens]|eukprot:GAQ83275.1 hypothetical protein KFL_001410320 [Klebsormidium nitens]
MATAEAQGQGPLVLRKFLLSSCLFLDALAAGAIPALLPFVVTARHVASDAREVAQLLAINYGCTLGAMIPSGLLLLYSWHVPLLAAGLFSLLGVCLLLGVSAHSEWQLQLAMVLAGCSAEFTFAGALAIVSKLQASEHAPKGTQNGRSLGKSSEVHSGQRRSFDGHSLQFTDENRGLVAGGKHRKQRSGVNCVEPGGGAGTLEECELRTGTSDAGHDALGSLVQRCLSPTCKSPEVRSPRSTASLAFSEERSLTPVNLEAPAIATDLVQDVGLLFGAQSLGYALGPSLVPLIYGFIQAWVPFLVIGALTAVLLPPLLFLLLPGRTKPRRHQTGHGSAWGGHRERGEADEDTSSKDDVPLLEAATDLRKPAKEKRSSGNSVPSLSDPELKAKQQGTSALRAFRELMTSPHALPAIVALLVEGVVVGSIDTVVPSFLKDTCHTSLSASGFVLGGYALAYAVVVYKGTSWVLQRVGDLHTMAGGMALMAAALPVLSLQTLCGKLWGQPLVMVVIGSGMALMSGPIFPRLLRALEKRGIESEGLAVIVYNVLYAGGMVVGPLITSLITKGNLSSHFLSLLSIVLMLTVLAIYFLDCIMARDVKVKAQEVALTRTTSNHEV